MSTGAMGAAGTPQQIREREIGSAPGVPMLFLGVALIGGGIALIKAQKTATIWTGLGLIVLGALVFGGLNAVAPGQARVVALFGRYQGTVRLTGLRWVNPFTVRKRMSTRIRNHETATLKVNDADGNPIEMAAVVVWQIADTAKASYAVEDVRTFVTTQAETAVRHIAGQYPYDARGMDRVSLRDNADQITTQLSEELTRRVAVAGVAV